LGCLGGMINTHERVGDWSWRVLSEWMWRNVVANLFWWVQSWAVGSISRLMLMWRVCNRCRSLENWCRLILGAFGSVDDVAFIPKRALATLPFGQAKVAELVTAAASGGVVSIRCAISVQHLRDVIAPVLQFHHVTAFRACLPFFAPCKFHQLFDVLVLWTESIMVLSFAYMTGLCTTFRADCHVGSDVSGANPLRAIWIIAVCAVRSPNFIPPGGESGTERSREEWSTPESRDDLGAISRWEVRWVRDCRFIETLEALPAVGVFLGFVLGLARQLEHVAL
jgi:hypothetical protein